MTNSDKLAPLITYEGIEGAGKSTQMKEVASHFQAQNLHVLLTREPGGTSIAEKIRSILIHPDEETLDFKTECLLMQAARVQHVQHVIVPNKASKDLILCDRFIDSSTAYQGVGRNLGVEWVEKLNMFATNNLLPDLTFFIDIPIELSIERMNHRKKQQTSKKDRFESEKIEFFTKIRKAYGDIAKRNPDRIVTLDGTLDKTTLVNQQIEKISEVLGQ